MGSSLQDDVSRKKNKQTKQNKLLLVKQMPQKWEELPSPFRF